MILLSTLKSFQKFLHFDIQSTGQKSHCVNDNGGVRALTIETIVALPTVSVPPQ